jgi:DNA helicase-2/ATP-dependent DNA helicase PcrA
MAKKDNTVSKRLAEEIALAKRIKDNPPSPSLLDLATPDQLDELAASLWFTPAVRTRFMGGWRQHREIYGYTLPSELPHALLNALRQHDDLDGLQYDILVVDEYQDLNACDLAVLRAIADRGSAIVGAGDDDQSIYSFRKAHPEGIRRFLADYEGAADYPLSITQRCCRRIVEWANFVIQGDPDRPVGRGVLQCAAGAPEGEAALLSFVGEVSEARGIATLTPSGAK